MLILLKALNVVMMMLPLFLDFLLHVMLMEGVATRTNSSNCRNFLFYNVLVGVLRIFLGLMLLMQSKSTGSNGAKLAGMLLVLVVLLLFHIVNFNRLFSLLLVVEEVMVVMVMLFCRLLLLI